MIIRGDRLVLVAAPGEALEFGPEDVGSVQELHRVIAFWLAGHDGSELRIEEKRQLRRGRRSSGGDHGVR